MTTPTADLEYRQRGVRILDAATELLLRFGYRRVTVEDIAKEAGVGKGTVYLHWKTKRDVFAMVLLRDAVALITVLLDRMRADPAEVLMHRVIRASYLEIMRRPISKALYTADIELLGALATSEAPGFQNLQVFGREHDRRHNEVLREHGLMLTDLDPVVQVYAINAACTGFFLLEGDNPFTENGLDDETKADALAATVRKAFEPPEEPDRSRLTAAAAEIVPLYEELLAECEALLPDRTSSTGEYV